MELRFEAPKGKRLHRYFWAVTSLNGELWWCHQNHTWVGYEEVFAGGSTHAPCKTLRAFKRMLRKHPKLVGNCVLVNKYKGYDVYSGEYK